MTREHMSPKNLIVQYDCDNVQYRNVLTKETHPLPESLVLHQGLYLLLSKWLIAKT